MKVQLLQIPILNDFSQSTHSAVFKVALLLWKRHIPGEQRVTKANKCAESEHSVIIFDLIAGQTVNPLTQHEMKT